MMLKAGIFDDFKGATTLLLWGDEEGVASLFSGLSDLKDGKRTELAVEGPGPVLTVRMKGEGTGSSTLGRSAGGLRWECSPDILKLACDLTEPLLKSVGHQFLDVDGLAEQVVIARDEYPADLS